MKLSLGLYYFCVLSLLSSCVFFAKTKGEKKDCEYSMNIQIKEDDEIHKIDSCYLIRIAGFSGIKEKKKRKKLVRNLQKKYVFCYNLTEENLKKYYFDSLCHHEGYCLHRVVIQKIEGGLGYYVSYQKCE
jgi:hypothetical protein